MQLYLGEWEEYFAADANVHTDRSHSEVDLALCHTLAFYCRGEMEQMDRLFRKSELMRDKWDRTKSGSTYGRLTMKKAISSCTSFYGQEDKAAASEDFEVISDSDNNHTSFLPPVLITAEQMMMTMTKQIPLTALPTPTVA